MSTPERDDWKLECKRKALAFRTEFEFSLREVERSIDIGEYGPHANQEIEVSFAHERRSHHWFTVRVKWGVLSWLMNANIPSATKDGIIFVPGPLTGGTSQDGTRRLKKHVESLHLVVLDFDKGDAPLDKLEARMAELGLESCMYATFSNLKETTTIAWSVTRPDPKTGNVETKPTAFQKFVRNRLELEGLADVDPAQVTGAIVRAYMVEEQGYDISVLGDLTVVETGKVETEVAKGKEGNRHAINTLSVVVKHSPLAKSRLVLLLTTPVVRRVGESELAFQSRWEEEIYLPLGRLIGFKFDPACASTERGHYAMTCKEGSTPIPARSVQGRTLDLQDPRLAGLLKPLWGPLSGNKQTKNKKSDRKAEARQEDRANAQDEEGNWLGFLAADAAADMLDSVTDKRADESTPLVAFACPFVHEHATSNNPSAHQCYAFNASSPDLTPTVKCQSSTCRDRPYAEFLDALFDASVKADPKYRIVGSSERTGVYIPRKELTAKLHEINRTWAVVRVGNRVRYLHESIEGDIELYDAKSLANWFSNWFYYWLDDKGRERCAHILPVWLEWQYRRQYRGVRFYPQPEGAPKGVFNTYYGFAVEPKAGSWKRLLAHIYRNVCRRDARYFRFFIAWLAQLVQEPHIKPGTNIVLKGKEGTGKSKVGEWVVALFGRNAIVVSESERITGRFNAHLENKLFLMAEEAFWAGDKAAEGKLKDLATGINMSYERKGLDPYEGKNYTRIMIASNEDWVVPASSGGRRWFALEVGDQHEKDYAYFAAIDREMEAGGLAAMLYDLQQTSLPQQVNVRSAPVTPWLVEQRLHSYDNKRRWWRGVLQEGGFRDNEAQTFIALDQDKSTAIKREDLFQSAKPYFVGPKGVDPTPSDVGQFVRKMLGELPESRPTIDGKRHWCSIFPPLKVMRQRWYEDAGEHICDESGAASSTTKNADARPHVHTSSAPTNATKVSTATDTFDPHSYADANIDSAVEDAVKRGITDPQDLTDIAEEAATAAQARWDKTILKMRH